TEKGEGPEAEKAFSKAIKTLALLEQRYGDRPRYTHLLGTVRHNRGNLLKMDGNRHREAREEYEQARDLWARLHNQHPDNRDYPEHLAMANSSLASLLGGRATVKSVFDWQLAEVARSHFARAAELRAPLLKRKTDTFVFRRNHARSSQGHAVLLMRMAER